MELRLTADKSPSLVIDNRDWVTRISVRFSKQCRLFARAFIWVLLLHVRGSLGHCLGSDERHLVAKKVAIDPGSRYFHSAGL